MDVCCNVFCDVAMCLICEIIVICNMLTLAIGANSRIGNIPS